VCVCVRERARERASERGEGGRERESRTARITDTCLPVRVCACSVCLCGVHVCERA